MAEKTTLEVYLIVDENGNYIVSSDYDDAGEQAENACTNIRRSIKLNVNVTIPEGEEVEVDVPDTTGETTTVKPE